MKFGPLILRKIFKFVNFATRGQILRLKSTKFDFGLGTAPDPARGAYSAPPDLVAFKGRFLRQGIVGNGKVVGERGGKRRGPQVLVYIPMSEILKNTLIAEII